MKDIDIWIIRLMGILEGLIMKKAITEEYLEKLQIFSLILSVLSLIFSLSVFILLLLNCVIK